MQKDFHQSAILLEFFRVVFTALLLVSVLCRAQSSYIKQMLENFENSSLIFEVGDHNAPFIPAGFVGASHYGDAEFKADNGFSLSYDVDHFSQAAGLPFLVNDRNLVVFGEYLSYTKFNISINTVHDFNVTIVGLPVGWINQVNEKWQFGAFVMPMGHDASLQGPDWEWQYMGGAMGRYV